MKVTINYAVDLEDVPMTISQLLGNLTKPMTAALGYINSGAAAVDERDGSNADGALESIDISRQLLAKVDMLLMDYSAILAGYMKAQADIKMGIDPSKPQGEADDQINTSDPSESEE